MSVPGEKFRADVSQDKLYEVAAQYERAGKHLWIVAASYGITDDEAAVASEGIDFLLDRDHLLNVTQLGCFICEKPYSLAVAERCKGNPVRYTEQGEPCYKDGTTGTGKRWR